MSGTAFRRARKARGWTQANVARQLGVSQPYVALLEAGKRDLPEQLAQRMVVLLGLDPVLLPLRTGPQELTTADDLARELGRLGYPGYAYLARGAVKNPAEVLVSALWLQELEPRIAEALPWLLLRYPDLDADWVAKQARLLNLTNRLGFVVDLARSVAERHGEADSPRLRALARLSDLLRPSRLDMEDTFGQSLNETEREWLRGSRSPEARFWHVLSDWRPELLDFAGEAP